ncbi:MAG: ceramidase domain-containing protein [Devosiaceae bacterium]|nr:ceramidase domain-containing protein [Devosiaceae bacterium MH13]
MGPGFWEEPLNAITNGAFLIAAGLLALGLRNSRDMPSWVLVGLLTAIGIGSFLFHTFATQWAALADVVPIIAFIVAAIVIALRRRFDLPWQAAALGGAGFLLAAPMVLGTPLATLIPNGSASYVPPLIVLVAIALGLAAQRSTYAWYFLAASGVFVVSLTLRTIDPTVCDAIPIGTHFGWHVLNAVTLYLIVRGLAPQQQTAH